MIAPYYPFLKKNAERFCRGNIEASHAPPPSNGGRAGARGVIIYHKTGFLQSKNFCNRILMIDIPFHGHFYQNR